MTKPKLDEFHYHEMTDRLHVIMSMIDDHLVQHPVAKLDKKINKLIDEANDKLAEAYQIAGNLEIKYE
jgi:hypothetical protein